MILWGLLGCGGLAETLFLRIEGADLRVRVEGPADPEAMILLLHGGPGGNSEEYNVGTWSETVEAEVAVAYLDQRGQGASQGIYDAEDVNILQLAEDVDAVLGLLEERYPGVSLYLMGHSWGGALGTLALLETDAPERVSGWIEVSGAHDVPLLNQLAVPMFISVGSTEIERGRHVRRWEEIVSFAEGVNPERITADISGQINRYGFEAETLIPEVSVDEALTGSLLGYYLTSSVGWPVEGWVGDHTGDLLAYEVEMAGFAPRLGEIDVPTLLVWGRYDFVVPPMLGADALERLPDAALTILPASGHSPMFNQPNRFSEAVLDFIADSRAW